jgi:hypothetical protein
LSDSASSDFFGGVFFDKSTDPQNLVNFEREEAQRAIDYSKKGVFYGSANFTDFDCCCDGLLEAFNGTELEDGTKSEPLSVEDGLHKCAIWGYDVTFFGYEISPEELAKHRTLSHSRGWGCRYECGECWG